MSINVEDYGALADTGFETYEPVKAEDEFFHSIYIGGVDRRNVVSGEIEKAGKLHIRGVQNNLDEVNMIITHIKQILVKQLRDKSTNKETLDCFCYQNKVPWQGTKIDPATGTNRLCGQTSAERAAVDFCSECRSQILVAGMLCDGNGSPMKDEDGKPMFGFLRARGMKYSNVADYLSELSQMEITDPVIDMSKEGAERFEKRVVNNKRVVTRITVGEANSRFGIKKVFELNKGINLPKNVTLEVLKIAKKTVDKFNDKFDWSKRKMAQSSGYGSAPDEDQRIPDKAPQNKGGDKPSGGANEGFSFEDADFDF